MASETTAGSGVENVRGVPHGSRGAVVAVGAVFAINGLAIGAWAGVLPALRTRLGIDAGTLAVLLFIVGVAAVVSMQVGGRMADRVGARRVTLTALPLMIAGAAVLAFAELVPARRRGRRPPGPRQRRDRRRDERARRRGREGAADAGDEPVPRVLEHRLVRRRGGGLPQRLAGRRRERVGDPPGDARHRRAGGRRAARDPAVDPRDRAGLAYRRRPEGADPAGRVAAGRDGRLLRADGGDRLRLVRSPHGRRGRGRPGHRVDRRGHGDAVHGRHAAGRGLGRGAVRAPAGRVVRRGGRGDRVCDHGVRDAGPGAAGRAGPSSGSAWR